MQCLRITVAILLAGLWLSATNHRLWDSWQILTQTEICDASGETADGCSIALDDLSNEMQQYLRSRSATRSSTPLRIQQVAAILPVAPNCQAQALERARPVAPSELLVGWRFSLREASLPRAPSLVS